MSLWCGSRYTGSSNRRGCLWYRQNAAMHQKFAICPLALHYLHHYLYYSLPHLEIKVVHAATCLGGQGEREELQRAEEELMPPGILKAKCPRHAGKC